MTKITQPPFSLNENITLQVQEAFSLYYFLKIGPKLFEQNHIYQIVSLEFLSKFLEEMHPDIFSRFPNKAMDPALCLLYTEAQKDANRLFDYVEKTSNSVFVSPELFFENIAVLKQRLNDSWFFPLKHHIRHGYLIDSKLENGLIAHYKYKYLSFPLHFGSFRSEKTE